MSGRKSIIVDRELIERLYFDERRPISEIVRSTGVKRCTIYHRLQQWGLPNRADIDATLLRDTFGAGSPKMRDSTHVDKQRGYVRRYAPWHPRASVGGA